MRLAQLACGRQTNHRCQIGAMPRTQVHRHDTDLLTGLGDGYQVDARITVFTQDDATIIPAGALFRRGDSWNVYVVADGRAQSRDVGLLRRSGRTAAIVAGLTQGERVIVYPSD